MPILKRLIPTALVLSVLAGMVVVGPAQAVPSKDRYAVGDSVMLGARSALKSRGFGVDASTSRQAYSGPALLRKKGAKLPENVVVHLGTNGTFPLDTCKRLVRVAGPERRVFLVNIYVPRSWEKSNNATIRKCANSFREGRVTVVDWNAEASQHPSWFYKDGIHLRPAGATAFARLLDTSVDGAIARSAVPTEETSPEGDKGTILGATGTAKVGVSG